MNPNGREVSIKSFLLKLTRHSIVYGFGQIAVRGIAFLLFPITTNYIDTAEMGVSANLYLLLALLTLGCQWGFGQAFLSRFGAASDAQERTRIFSNAFLGTGLSVLISALLVIGCRSDLSGFLFHTEVYRQVLTLSGLILAGDVLAQIPLLALRCEGKSFSYVFLHLAAMGIQFALTLFFVITRRMGVQGLFLGNAASSLFLALALFPVVKRYLRLSLDKTLFYSMLRFGFPTMISGLFINLIDLSDRFILERLTDLDTVGIYNAGYRLGSVIALAVAGFRFAWLPLTSTLTVEEARMHLPRVPTYFLMVSGWLFLLVLFFLPDLAALRIGSIRIVGEKYIQGLSVVPWILIAYLFYGFYVLLLPGLYLMKRSAMLPLITGFGAIVNMAGNCILIPRIGMQGAAVSTVLAYGITMVGLFLYSQRHLRISYEYGRLGVLLCTLIAMGSAGFWLVGDSFLIKGVLFLMFPLILYFLGFFRKAEVMFFRTAFQALSEKRRR